MPVKKLIAAKDFCRFHDLDSNFIKELQRYEIIDFVTVKKAIFIESKNLHRLEKVVRIYNDLQLNFEGLATVLQLLSALEKQQDEIRLLRNELKFFS